MILLSVDFECSILTNDQLMYIIDLAYNSNKGGKRRKLTKEEYIKRYILPRKNPR